MIFSAVFTILCYSQ